MPLDATTIRAWRLERKLSQTEVARLLGVSMRYLCSLEDQEDQREIPVFVELAYAALTLGVYEYSGGGIQVTNAQSIKEYARALVAGDRRAAREKPRPANRRPGAILRRAHKAA